MYRARVEAVSGIKVRAGGKWLTCIGNRTVKAGDLVWTDGRCVYGHDREGQAPLVIAPPKEDLAIPILIGKNLFTFRKNNLEQVSSSEFSGRLLNDAKGHVFYSKSDSINLDAANLDAEGDLFFLQSKSAYLSLFSYKDEDGQTAVGVPPKIPELNVKIEKNRQVVNQAPVTDLIQEVVDKNAAEASALPAPEANVIKPGGDEYTYVNLWLNHSHYGNVIYSFIDDDHSWAFVYFASIRTHKSGVLMASAEEPPVTFSPVFSMEFGHSYSDNFYYIDSSGRRALIAQGYEHFNNNNDNGYDPETNRVICRSQKTFDLEQLRFPIQDGYFFTMSVLSWSTTTPTAVRYDVFSPNNDFLFSYEEPIGVYFSIYKLSASRYLVGIKSSIFSGIPFGQHRGGLYFCENGTLTPITSTGDSFSCLNYRLYPMKRWRNWWERVQTLA